MADARFVEAEQSYRSLKQELDAGRITGERFEQALRDRMIESEGCWWMLGANTGRWYAYDGQAWVEREPAAAPVTAVARGEDQPSAPPVAASKDPFRRAANLVALVLGALALGGLGLVVFISLKGGVDALTNGDPVGGTISVGFGLFLLGAVAAGLRGRRRARR